MRDKPFMFRDSAMMSFSCVGVIRVVFVERVNEVGEILAMSWKSLECSQRRKETNERFGEVM